jgi:predicted DNA-binding transcriptional regulator AlpA
MARLAPAGIEPALTLADWTQILRCSRREVERMKSAGKLPPPDFKVGRMPRWKPETVRRWIDEQAGGRGVP